nr:MAG TPA: hypothetical protein [Caudoviricetes sp.]
MSLTVFELNFNFHSSSLFIDKYLNLFSTVF